MRHWWYQQLHTQAWTDRGVSPVNIVVIVAILTSIIITILETEKPLTVKYNNLFISINLTLGIFFILEVLLRLWTCTENKKFNGPFGRFKYVMSPIFIIDIIAIIPFFVTSGTIDGFFLRIFRLMRILMLARLGRFSEAMKNIGIAIKKRGYELILSFGLALFIMLIAATALYATEHETNPESFGSIPRALWWGVATVTKVGYAGAFPTTILGKFAAALIALAAVGVVALPTGILAAALSEAFEKAREKKN